ncbi:MAG: TIGR03905 family TSCPD domain-containing protein [Bacillota bacterium]|nr:TIGR03905 family TSCPD domain-containing protein [Bacillota bacterium]
MFTFKPKGVCSKQIQLQINGDDTIDSVEFVGGCSGNLLGLSKLVEGMKAQEALAKLKGIRCDSKKTSCPDQLAKAIEEYYSQK